MKVVPVIRLLAVALFLSSGATYADCNPEPGRKQFAKCAACHSVEAGVHGAGPSLAGIIGRTAGTHPGFFFSQIIIDSGIVWDPRSLSSFLKEPQSLLPGNVMPFGGMRNEQQREALICYLATL